MTRKRKTRSPSSRSARRDGHRQEIQLRYAYNAQARWMIMQILCALRPLAVNTEMFRLLMPVFPGLSIVHILIELWYLDDLGLVALDLDTMECWSARLTPAGVDVVEYNVQAPPGVARPAA